jgi:hypothetical protein
MPPDTEDDGLISAAIERTLVDELDMPSATETECRCYYKNHLKELQRGDLVWT